MGDKLKEFLDKSKELQNDKQAAELQHKKGKLTTRERLKHLLDADSFVELDAFAELQSKELEHKKRAGDGIVTGYGTISKKPVYVYSQDFSFMGGSMGEMHNRRIVHVMELALKTGCPCIGLLDSGGGRIFQLNTLMSGIVPQISVILGPCAGIAVYSPALTDFIFMVKNTSYMFITGPDVIKTVTGENKISQCWRVNSNACTWAKYDRDLGHDSRHQSIELEYPASCVQGRNPFLYPCSSGIQQPYARTSGFQGKLHYMHYPP